ncbi:MAG: ImmA/IrrE family metallo-endopeptidase [Sphingomonadaceae bacterium]|nr:ImmA/IrrE family metallo-endopeptidase [Sphingomonadaceae bacterium]
MSTSGKTAHFVAPRTRRQIEAIANAVREHLGIRSGGRIAMQPILEFALDDLVEGAYYDIVNDAELGGAEGMTRGTEPVILLSASCYMRLGRSDNRARMTVAHELGHLLLHSGRHVFHFEEPLNDPRFDPEWQADEFAAALLMPREAFSQMKTVQQAMATFGVSKAAAIRRARVIKIRLSDGRHSYGHDKKKGYGMTRTP